MNKINIFRYIGYNNPQAAYDLLTKAGYKDIKKDREYVSALLAHWVANDREKALNELMLIHPDRETLLEGVSSDKKITGERGNGDFLNCNGNCGKCAFRSADGAEEESKTNLSEKTINMLILGGSVVLGTVLLTLIITNVRNK